METIKEVLAAILIITVVLFIVSGAIHILLYTLGIREKITLKIKLPKRKKYLTKVDPIYQLRGDHCSNSSYYIHKWKLGYIEQEWIELLLILIPYPIDIFVYKYEHVDVFYLCEKSGVENINRDLKDLYEEMYEEKYAEQIAKEKENNKLQSKVDQLNKVFTENYE